jgi:O-antigen/teichoic acid export membrane protein
MRRLYDRLGLFWQQVATLSTGNLIAQGFGVLSILLLPRLYVEADFGLYAVFFATVAIGTVLINGGYEYTLMLPDAEAEARALWWLCVRIALVSSGLLLLLSVGPLPWLLARAGAAALRGWHWLLPLSLLLEGLAQPLRQWLNREQAYRAMSVAKASRSGLLLLVSAALGWVGWAFPGLILGLLAGQLAEVLLLGRAFHRRGPVAPPASHSWRSHARAYGDFPRYALPGNAFNIASKFLPAYLFIPLFGEAMAGQYNQAERVLMLPIVLVSLAVGGVFFQQASQAARESEAALARLTRRTTWQLAALGLPFLLVIMLWGPQLFGWVLGENWTEAGHYARWLMPWIYLTFIVVPLTFLTDIKRQLKAVLLISLGLFLARLAVLTLLAPQLTALQTVQAYSLAGVLLVSGQLGYLLYLGGVFRR